VSLNVGKLNPLQVRIFAFLVLSLHRSQNQHLTPASCKILARRIDKHQVKVLDIYWLDSLPLDNFRQQIHFELKLKTLNQRDFDRVAVKLNSLKFIVQIHLPISKL
jgi:hypothetical protein